MIHELFDRHRLEGAPNFRDLGGLPAADGRRIKYGRLLRCGHLAYITPEDGEKLLHDYHLKTVIDMRTENEINRRPDTVLPGVEYLRCPIFEKKAEGVTRETAVPHNPVESALRMAHNVEGSDPHQRMIGLYGKFFEEEGLQHYAEFFNLLLAQEEGATLWHCTMGKDRCGTGAILLETALGVPPEMILADYLYTAERLNPVTEETIRQARLVENDDTLMNIIRIMDNVHPDYLNRLYEIATELCGGMDSLIREKLGMTEEKLIRLRELYLE
ncbi:MAG: tyrosine-protein phosphatase [Oscillospiraceae bacterium]|nr:tyrosine-protein phosphatase [Oscillospiraceae bacterium]